MSISRAKGLIKLYDAKEINSQILASVVFTADGLLAVCFRDVLLAAVISRKFAIIGSEPTVRPL